MHWFAEASQYFIAKQMHEEFDALRDNTNINNEHGGVSGVCNAGDSLCAKVLWPSACLPCYSGYNRLVRIRLSFKLKVYCKTP